MMYDIIGDVHGHAKLLRKLLVQLGYKKNNNRYEHPDRQAVFVGDFINRGPQIRETLRLIKSMVDNGNALAILGNHEINAIIFNIKKKSGTWLVPRLSRGRMSLVKTLQEFEYHPEEWDMYRKWFKTLPLFLELDGIRVVHACWMDNNIEVIRSLSETGKIKNKVFKEIYKKQNSKLGKNIWQTTKGLILALPKDLRVKNNKGINVQRFRVKWWESAAGKTFQEISFDNSGLLPKYTVPSQIIPEYVPYPDDAPLVFIGHYCKPNGPYILKPNVCCVDSCVAGSKVLTAYRWSGEKEADPKNLISVY